MRRPLAIRALVLSALCACAGPKIRVTTPAEPLPDLFVPVTWATTCAQLQGSPGVRFEALREDGRGCTARLTRAPLGEVELRLDFRAGPERFTSVALVRQDTTPCCGAEPSFDLTVAYDLLRRAVEMRLGPPLATLTEGKDRSAEWRQAGYVLTAGLYGARPGAGWQVILDAVPAAYDANGRPVHREQLLGR
jgi:hypothetical protein